MCLGGPGSRWDGHREPPSRGWRGQQGWGSGTGQDGRADKKALGLYQRSTGSTVGLTSDLT